jgi:hypothetical protein
MTATSAVSLHHAEKVTADIRCLEKLIDRYLQVTISLGYSVCALLSFCTQCCGSGMFIPDPGS